MTRKQYRAKLQRQKCWACEQNIFRGMPVVYVDNKPVHVRCEHMAELSVGQTPRRTKP